MAKSNKLSNRKNNNLQNRKVNKRIRKQRGGGNFFYSVFTGTLGYLAGMFVYGFIILLILIMLGLGIYLVYTAKECKQVVDNTQDPNQGTTKGQTKGQTQGQTQGTTKTKTECSEFVELDGIQKIKFIIGCILVTIFGLAFIIIILPDLIRGVGFYLGGALVNSALD